MCDLVAQALTNRPELRQNRYLVGEVLQLLRREKYAPLVPSVILGAELWRLRRRPRREYQRLFGPR